MVMEHAGHKAALQARIDLPQGSQGFGAAGAGQRDLQQSHVNRRLVLPIDIECLLMVGRQPDGKAEMSQHSAKHGAHVGVFVHNENARPFLGSKATDAGPEAVEFDGLLQPSITGMSRSRTIRSIAAPPCKTARASLPFAAVNTLKPASSAARVSPWRVISLTR